MRRLAQFLALLGVLAGIFLGKSQGTLEETDSDIWNLRPSDLQKSLQLRKAEIGIRLLLEDVIQLISEKYPKSRNLNKFRALLEGLLSPDSINERNLQEHLQNIEDSIKKLSTGRTHLDENDLEELQYDFATMTN